jgi:glutathione S-transferase
VAESWRPVSIGGDVCVEEASQSCTVARPEPENLMPLADPVLKVYALFASILALHLLALALWTGAVRVRRKVWVNPEDAKFNKGEQVEADHPDTQRVKRAHQNGLENAVPFFVVGLLYALSNPSTTGAWAYFGTFVGARVLHSFAYLWGRQPFRTMLFAVGVLATTGMAIHVIRVAI